MLVTSLRIGKSCGITFLTLLTLSKISLITLGLLEGTLMNSLKYSKNLEGGMPLTVIGLLAFEIVSTLVIL